ncbi:hypothetical protein MYBA111488_13045 [Mycobacterium basiliense]
MKSCSRTSAECVVGAGRPVSTQLPPLRVIVRAAPTSAASIIAAETTTASAMTPRVNSRTNSLASAAVAAVWVAPKLGADVRLNSTGSTATMRAAPLIRAPWMAAVPMPPAPIATTVSSPHTLARRAAEPCPGGWRQPAQRDVFVGGA